MRNAQALVHSHHATLGNRLIARLVEPGDVML
jgi:hypothetical protein